MVLLLQVGQPLLLRPPMLRPARTTPMISHVHMQEDGGERERSRSRSAVISRPKPKPKEKAKEEVDKESNWRVLLHNDDVG